MTLALALVGMLAGGALEPPAKAPSPSESAVNFDTVAPAPATSEDARVKRFIGAFTGGVVGLGAAMAVMPLVGDCPFGRCVGPFQVILGALAPLIAASGAWLGFELMGGDGGLMAPVVAFAPALLLSLGLLAIARETDSSTAVQLLPYLISAGFFLAGGAALALDSRARQLEGLGAAASWGKASPARVAVTVLVSTLTGATAVITSGLLFIAGLYSPLGVGMMIGGAALGSFGAAAAAWGVHRGMNGKGSFGAALAGMGLALAVSGAGLGLFALATPGGIGFGSPTRSAAGLTLVTTLAVTSAMFLPMLALEFSHTNAVEASLPKITFGASPTPNGGMIAAGMRF